MLWKKKMSKKEEARGVSQPSWSTNPDMIVSENVIL